MASAAIKRVQGLLERYSAGDESAIPALVAPEFFTHVPEPGEPTATQVFAELAAGFRAAVPDLEVEIPDLAEGDDGYLHGTAVFSGTQSGPLWGVPPLGLHHRFEVPVVLRPVGDRFAINFGIAPPAAVGILRAMEAVNPPDQMHLPPRHPYAMPDVLAKVLFTGQVGDKPCRHLDDVRVTRSARAACDDCGPDEIWPALRLCLTCGHVGCCDTSLRKHAKAHWEATGHPLMRSIHWTERWIWCYADSAAFTGRTLDRLEARLAEAG